MQQVGLITAAPVGLQVEPGDLLQRRSGLQLPEAIGVGNSERDDILRGLPFRDQLPVPAAAGLVAEQLVGAGRQHPHLLHQLLAVQTVGNDDLFT